MDFSEDFRKFVKGFLSLFVLVWLWIGVCLIDMAMWLCEVLVLWLSLNVDELVLDIGGLVKLCSFGMLKFWFRLPRGNRLVVSLGVFDFQWLFECFDYVLRPSFSRKLYMNSYWIGWEDFTLIWVCGRWRIYIANYLIDCWWWWCDGWFDDVFLSLVGGAWLRMCSS
jgi:hypothetical protein